MRFAFDIGGVISKYPEQFRHLAVTLAAEGNDVFVITDMHNKAEVVEMLADNGFGFIDEVHVFCADYQKHGEFCKAILLRDLKIDFFFDDFVGYVQWDSSFGPAPVRMLIAPDGFRPYWHDGWKVKDGHDFGRRVYKKD